MDIINGTLSPHKKQLKEEISNVITLQIGLR